MQALCPWDQRPVSGPGQTCDAQCYYSWVAWRLSLVEQPRLIVLQPDETAPLDASEQDWYDVEIRKDI